MKLEKNKTKMNIIKRCTVQFWTYDGKNVYPIRAGLNYFLDEAIVRASVF